MKKVDKIVDKESIPWCNGVVRWCGIDDETNKEKNMETKKTIQYKFLELSEELQQEAIDNFLKSEAYFSALEIEKETEWEFFKEDLAYSMDSLLSANLPQWECFDKEVIGVFRSISIEDLQSNSQGYYGLQTSQEFNYSKVWQILLSSSTDRDNFIKDISHGKMFIDLFEEGKIYWEEDNKFYPT